MRLAFSTEAWASRVAAILSEDAKNGAADHQWSRDTGHASGQEPAMMNGLCIERMVEFGSRDPGSLV